jgi:hypothetical protein
MVAVVAVSMVGGTIFPDNLRKRSPPQVIQREIFQSLGPQPFSGDTGKDAVLGTAREKFVLDTEFALIEGHPRVTWATRRR